MTQDQKNTIERDFNESMLRDIEETKILEQAQLDEIQEDTTSMEEKIEAIDKIKIPDMTPDEEDRFENERQGGKSIFDDEPEEEY